jgi:polar amino acid transport system substrate-binding protein
MSNAQVVVVKNGSNISKLTDLAGKKVAVQKDSSGLAALNDKADLKNSFGSLVEMDSYLNALMELEMGSVDAIVMDEIVARYQIQKSKKDFLILDESVATEEYGVGFLKGNTALRDKVQNVMDQMAKDGKMAEISKKWFGTDVTTLGK